MTHRNWYGETQVLDDAARATLPGQFVRLSDGVTHYELAGPEDGQAVVLICGFSTPYFLWDRNFTALAEAGLRVLRYDLFGRGYSDRPKATYGPDLFDRQLLELLETLHINRPVDLVGLSMGGAIATIFTDRHPERVRKLCLIGPAGYPFAAPAAMGLLRWPLVPELIYGLGGDRFVLSGLARDFYRPGDLSAYSARYRAAMGYQGFRRALVSTVRHMPIMGLQEVYERVGQLGKPILLIWGEEDHTVPFALHERVLQALPGAEFHAIPEAGHVAQYERPELVNPLLIRFLRSPHHPAPSPCVGKGNAL